MTNSIKSLTKQDLKQIQSLEEELWRTETRFNISRMRELLADDFFEFGMSGRSYTLEDTLAVDSQEIKSQLPLLDFKARMLDDNVAQVTYNSAVEYADKVIYARRSSIWTRKSGLWKLRFHQGTQYEPNS